MLTQELSATESDEEQGAVTTRTLKIIGPSRLPHSLTPLVGRGHEVALALDLLHRSDVRLLTLTGPGGVGKTRLSLEIGRLLEQESGEFASFVNLAPIADPDLVLVAIAATVGITGGERSTLMARLIQTIGNRRMVLIADNFEQVVVAGPQISTLLSHCEGLRILATSRMPLRVQGEQEMVVPPLALPAISGVDLEEISAFASVALFVQRAQAVRRDFALTDDTAEIVAEICRRLDGLPLAIELAAPRLKIFSPATLRDRLSDRLNVLTGGSRDLPSRLQTMRSAIRWSYDLLSPEDQMIFRRLSLFRGTFSFSAAEVIAGSEIDAMDGLFSLIDKSLVHRIERESGETRFRMLETIREFGLDQLRAAGEEQEMSLRLLGWGANLASEAEDALAGADQATWMQTLDDDLANLRLGCEIAREQHALRPESGEQGLQLASGMWRYWLIRGQLSEGTQWLEQLLDAHVDASPRLEADARNNLGNLYFELGRLGEAQECYVRSLDLFASIGARDNIADELNNLGLVEMIRGNLAEAKATLEDSLVIRRELGDRFALPSTLCNLADIATVEGEYDRAEQFFSEAYGVRREAGNRRGLAFCCHGLGLVARYRGNLALAERWFEEGMTHAIASTDAYCTAILQVDLGMIETARQELGPALEMITPALLALRKMGSRRMMSEALDGLAEAAILAREYDLAARLLGGSQMLRDEEAIGFTTRSRSDLDILGAKLRQWVGDEVFHAQFELGRRHVHDTLIDEAVSLLAIAHDEPTRDGVASEADARPHVDTDAAQRLGLTRRELEILALLMHGFSDKEIADQLSISPRTAMNHVSKVLAKLGVNRRAAAANIAFQNRLVDPAAPLPTP